MSTGGESQPVAEARRKSREPWMHAHEKSDEAIVLKKGPKAGQPGEVLEGRAEAKGNMQSAPMLRTQSRDSVSRGLLRVRQRARSDHSWPDELFHGRPEVGARCRKSARRDLSGGRLAGPNVTRVVPTGIENPLTLVSCSLDPGRGEPARVSA